MDKEALDKELSRLGSIQLTSDQARRLGDHPGCVLAEVYGCATDPSGLWLLAAALRKQVVLAVVFVPEGLTDPAVRDEVATSLTRAGYQTDEPFDLAVRKLDGFFPATDEMMTNLYTDPRVPPVVVEELARFKIKTARRLNEFTASGRPESAN